MDLYLLKSYRLVEEGSRQIECLGDELIEALPRVVFADLKLVHLLLSAEDSVARIAKTGNDISVIVEALVESCGVDLNVGVILDDLVYAFGCGNEAHECDVSRASCFNHSNSIGCRAAGCEHRVNYDDEALLDIGWHLAVIFNREVSFGIAVETDVSHSCNRNETEKSVYHTETCTENGHDSQLLSGDSLECSLLYGSVDGNVLEGPFLIWNHSVVPCPVLTVTS